MINPKIQRIEKRWTPLGADNVTNENDWSSVDDSARTSSRANRVL